MSLEEIKKIAVIGAGAMDHGIAQVSVMARYRVAMLNISKWMRAS